MTFTEEDKEKLIKAFDIPREEHVKTMAALIAFMTMSRIINHQMRQTIKDFKNSMKEFTKEEREQIEEMASNALLEPIDQYLRKQFVK